jgi:hypothetical protein
MEEQSGDCTAVTIEQLAGGGDSKPTTVCLAGGTSVGQLKNGLMYVIQPITISGNIVSSTENVEYQTVQVLGQQDVGMELMTGSMAASASAPVTTTAMLITTATGDVISGAADLASLLTAAGIANVKEADSTAPS